jgi:hypothetical protein
MFENAHYTAETAARLHYRQICIVFIGALGDDCDEALKYW